MCGIAGVLHFDRDRAVDRPILDRMTDVLSHRGPDGRGVHVDGPFGLGHRRLSIIDLSPAAAQPLANENGSVLVAVNGEIYNFQSLRHELGSKGHAFRSRGDSEVLVHLYEEEGDELVHRLRGMYAFALWDARRRRLLLARDRFGQKPLYYRLTERGVRFASEIKGILEDPAVPRRPDWGALDAYLSLGYVPAPATAFEGIRKLPPGSLLTVEADGRHRLRRYWRLEVDPERAPAASPGERAAAARRLLELLDEATRLRMLSDRPLGALLSGGLDSSAVVASMCAGRPAGGEAVKTFSIGFAEPGFDETAYAAEVARHLATDHRRLEVTADALADLERIAWHYGEPFADASCLPTFALCELARRHVTVALTGDGGDELFIGYRRYLTMRIDEWIRRLASPLRGAARSRLAAGLARRARRKALAADLERSRRYAGDSPVELYLSRLEAATPGLKAGLYGDSLSAAVAGSDPRGSVIEAVERARGASLAERCARADGETYLPDDILVKVDVASMAYGLECRSPLLDHVLAEYVASLPFDLLMPRGRRKALFKAAVAQRLPRRILTRRKKGFSIPLQRWLGGAADAALRETILSRRAVERGLFRRPAVERLLDEHARGVANHQAPLFALLMLELWQRQWIDRPAGREVVETRPEAEAVGGR